MFTKQSKNQVYLHYENLLFTEEERKFTYPAEHPLTGEYEEQMVALQREYTGEGDFF